MGISHSLPQRILVKQSPSLNNMLNAAQQTRLRLGLLVTWFKLKISWPYLILREVKRVIFSQSVLQHLLVLPQHLLMWFPKQRALFCSFQVK
jgi:hypothetical protein